MKSATGTLTFGTGADPKADPYIVTVKYKIDGGNISYVVESTPWAVVRKNGISVTRTPTPSFDGDPKTVIELNAPGAPKVQITIRFTPP